VAECIDSLSPEAEIFSLMADGPGIPDELRARHMPTSFLADFKRRKAIIVT
jgi:hypothetical protein